MNKELEYINEIQNELDKNPRDKWKAYWNGRCNVIRKSLTLPTENVLLDIKLLDELIDLLRQDGIGSKQLVIKKLEKLKGERL